MKCTRGPVLLVIMDGWGLRTEKSHNAVALARTPNYDLLTSTFPSSDIKTSGLNVGLPKGTMGDSEVGHLNLGAGRVVRQQIMKIDAAIDERKLTNHPVLLESMELVRSRGTRLHLFGLISGALVHSSEKHYLALIELAAQAGVDPNKLFFHAFTDGRDSPPNSSEKVMLRLESHLKKFGGRVATVMGRYYAMDRDRRWARTRLAYEAMVLGSAEWEAKSGQDAIRLAARRSLQQRIPFQILPETDEFIRPTVITDSEGPIGCIGDFDVAISFNHRSDRARQIIRTLSEKDFVERTRNDMYQSFNPINLNSLHLVTMTDYRAGFGCPVVFTSNPLKGTMAEVVSRAGHRQLHVAETEKYPHVTFFLNGGRETPFDGEERCILPSPEVSTYDQEPNMSASEITKEVLKAIGSDQYKLVVINYANGDMVGHTGDLEAAVKAVESVDREIGKIAMKVLEVGGEALITADHGNCEQMWDEEKNSPHTSHTTNPVPCILVSQRYKNAYLGNGRLADIAPTILGLLGLRCPVEMEGENLLEVNSLG